MVCRKRKEEKSGVIYHYGNAKDIDFMSKVLGGGGYDSIVDFCLYTPEEFLFHYEALLNATDQYICLSSVQVCADVEGLKTEETPRFMENDPPVNKLFGGNNHLYCYEKARIEDVLKKSYYTNWTIIRPGITMGEDHYMWGDFLNEDWTYRILWGKTVVIPKNMLNLRSSIACGDDVALMLKAIIGDKITLGQIYNVTSYIYTWGELLEKYQSIFNRIGKPIKIKYIDNHIPLVKYHGRSSCYYRTRCIDRSFDSSKVYELMDNKHIPRDFSSLDKKLEQWIRKDMDRIPEVISEALLSRVA